MRERAIRLSLGILTVAHTWAAMSAPGALWGLSAWAVWPRGVLLACTGLALVAVLFAPRLSATLPAVAFPGRRGAAVIAAASGVVLWLLRERSHFFGDGYLVIREEGFALTVERAPLLVEACSFLVRSSKTTFQVGPAAVLASLSILSGVLAVYLLCRLCTVLASRDSARFLCLGLMLTAGSLQLFFGHVEFYAPLATAVIAHVLYTCRALRSGRMLWLSLATYPLLAALHLSALALLPSQVLVAWRTWRRQRPATIPALIGGLGVAALLVRWVERDAQVGRTLVSGITGVFEPYFKTGSAHFAFGLFDPQHFLAVLNDLFLNAPSFVALLPIAFVLPVARTAPARRTASEAHGDLGHFLALGAGGVLLMSFVFYRELGFYRDWDIFAPYSWTLLAWIACRLLARGRPSPGDGLAIVVVGLFHLAPWVALNASADRTMQHLQTVMQQESQWSPHARGYMNEEMAIYHRMHGDAIASFQAYQRAVEANPADARYRVGLANRYVDRGDFERAAQHFEAAVHKRPDLVGARIGLAQSLLRAGGDPRVAHEHAEAAVRLEPGNATAYYVQAVALVALQRHDEARTSLDRALQINPRLQAAAKLRRRIDQTESP